MAKIIIPKTSLPSVSDELTNKLRYRIINKNRNLFSEWSVIGEIKRDLEQTNFDENQTSFSASSSVPNRVDVTWYTPNINQNFDIYVRYKTRQVYSPTPFTWYLYENLQFLGRKDTNSISLSRLPLSDRSSIYSLNSYAVQVMVKLQEYPRIESVPINITQFRRKDNFLEYWLQRDAPFRAGDYVNINLNSYYSFGTERDNSIFAGIRRVSSVGGNGPNTFSVASTGANTPLLAALDVGATSPNNVAKINGAVEFVTGDILFT
jgi:hypothetical protein